MILPQELPGDLFDKLRDTIGYYLRCAHAGVTDHPDTLKPEDWATGATLNMWKMIEDYLEVDAYLLGNVFSAPPPPSQVVAAAPPTVAKSKGHASTTLNTTA